MISLSKDVKLQKAKLKAGDGIRFTTPHGNVDLLTVYDTRSSSSSSVKKGLFKTKVTNSGSSNSVARECELDPGDGKIEFDVGGLVRAEVRASGSTLRKVLADNDFDRIVYSVMSDSSDSWSKKKSQLSPGVITVLSLAAAMAVPGVGSGIMGSMITAGLKGLASNLAAKTATAKGNVLKGLKGLRDKGVVKGVLRSMAMVGLTAGILSNSAVAELDGLTKIVVEASTKATINMAMDVAIDGVKPSEAAKNAARSTVADTVCGALANKLGKEYRDGGIHYVPHKLMHAAIGGAFAKIQGKDIKAGALAGFAEAAAESYRSANPDKFGDGAEAVDLIEYNKASTFATELGSLAAASMAAVLGLDAAIAAESGANAVRNNAVGLLITAGITAWTAYEVYEAYQEGGAEAAVEELVKIGVITVVTGATGKIAYSVAGKTFPTAIAAFERVAWPLLNKIDAGLQKFGSKMWQKMTAKTQNMISEKAAQKYLGVERKFWTKDPIEFNGNKVYQRNDLFDPKQMTEWVDKEITKLGTNLERMKIGKAPVDFNGKSIELHHMLQTHNGPICEVTKKFHQKQSRIIHINNNKTSSGINRNKFNNWKKEYWKNRSKEFY